MSTNGSGGAAASDESVVERYVEALAFFGGQVQGVQDHEWDLDTPCPDWNVKQLVAHVVLGEALVRRLIDGADADDQVEVDASVLGIHPMSTWRGTALAAIDAARTPGIVTKEWDHPSGRNSGGQILGSRISENLVHGWDVSVAVGRPVQLPDELAEFVLDFWMPAFGDLSGSGDYGSPIEPPPGAAAGVRLLALLGRS